VFKSASSQSEKRRRDRKEKRSRQKGGTAKVSLNQTLKKRLGKDKKSFSGGGCSDGGLAIYQKKGGGKGIFLKARDHFPFGKKRKRIFDREREEERKTKDADT